MKVVLFCGGLGTRLREHSDAIPKPLVNVGYRPMIWHLMRYYAHFGHKEFVLCLGYRGDMIREYFLRYNECMTNDFTLSEGGRRIDLRAKDIERLENHVRRHRAARQHRSATAAREAAYVEGEDGLPRQLLRRAVGPAARPDDQRLHDQESGRKLRCQCVRGTAFTPCRLTPMATSRSMGPVRNRRSADQRRVLHPASRNLRLHRGRR